MGRCASTRSRPRPPQAQDAVPGGAGKRSSREAGRPAGAPVSGSCRHAWRSASPPWARAEVGRRPGLQVLGAVPPPCAVARRCRRAGRTATRPGPGARQVVLAHHAQQLAFGGGEAAVLPHPAVEAAHGMQQVDVLAAEHRVGQPRQRVARAQQRPVSTCRCRTEARARFQPRGELRSIACSAPIVVINSWRMRRPPSRQSLAPIMKARRAGPARPVVSVSKARCAGLERPCPARTGPAAPAAARTGPSLDAAQARRQLRAVSRRSRLHDRRRGRTQPGAAAQRASWSEADAGCGIGGAGGGLDGNSAPAGAIDAAPACAAIPPTGSPARSAASPAVPAPLVPAS